jgi:Fe2+ transport system protein FeoA
MISLYDLQPGQSSEVLSIKSADSGRLMKLSALGLVPGSTIRLQQRYPAFIIWVDETQLSLDSSVAKEIMVSAG